MWVYLERLRLPTKLLVGIASGIVLAVVVGLHGLNSLDEQQATMDRLFEDDLVGISHIKDANLNLTYMSRAMRHMLIAQDDATRDAALATVKRAREQLMVELAEARKRIYRPEGIALYEAFQANLTPALEHIEQAVGMIQREKMNPSVAAKFITSAEFVAVIAAADSGLHELTKSKEKAADAAVDAARANAKNTRTLSIFLLVLGAGVTGVLGLLTGLSIQRPNERVRKAVESLAAGEVEATVPHVDYPNEVGILARAIEVLQGIYRQSNTQHWVKSNVSDLAVAMQQTDDFRSLAQAVVSRLAPLMDAGHGAFYVADEQRQFKLLAGYGYRERKHLSNVYRLGEGLVGQSAMEKAPILLTAPQDYIRIGSGLGDAPPACVLVQPVIHADKVLGVLEVASFQPFTDRHKALVEALLPVLGSSMEILDRNLRTRELLAATQEQALRMEKQAAQLEEQAVEMEAQQAELLDTENWFRSVIDVATQAMLVVEESGHILLANAAVTQLSGYAGNELLGMGVARLLPGFVLGIDHQMGDRSHQLCTHDGAMWSVAVHAAALPGRGGRGNCWCLTLMLQAASPSDVGRHAASNPTQRT